MAIVMVFKRATLLVLLMTLAACVGSTPPATFYLLEPIADTGSELAYSAGKPSLALAPVRIPHYLERAQLLTASGKNTYELDEMHRWAESLDDNMTRVLLQNIAVLVPANVVIIGGREAKQADAHLSVTILDFFVDPQGLARLTASWQLRRGNDAVLSRQSAYRVPVGGDEVQLKVEALNQCLNQLSREIVAAAKGLLADKQK